MRGGVTRYIGLEVTSKGFCFAVLEDTERLIDWGGREVSGDTSVFIGRLEGVIDRYRPDTLVLEDPAGSRKGKRVREWLVWAEEYAHERQIKPKAIQGDAIQTYRATFGPTKHDLALGLSRLFPVLAPLVPPPRKTWESERRRTGIFIALARTLLAAQGRQDAATDG